VPPVPATEVADSSVTVKVPSLVPLPEYTTLEIIPATTPDPGTSAAITDWLKVVKLYVLSSSPAAQAPVRKSNNKAVFVIVDPQLVEPLS
jgi:hypothetical protein